MMNADTKGMAYRRFPFLFFSATRCFFLGGVLMVAACSPNETDVRGSIKGFSMAEAHASSYLYETKSLQVLLVVISDQENVCDAMAAGHFNLEMSATYDVRPSTRTLAWVIFNGDDGPIASGPVPFGVPAFGGKSPVPPPKTGQYGYPLLHSTSANCGSGDTSLYPKETTFDPTAAQVKFQLETWSADRSAEGSFSIHVGGESLEGEVSASHCDNTKTRASFHKCP